jgi:hypothetical protein
MMNVRGGLAIRCPFGEGADQLLRRTFHPAHLALEVCQALYKEQRSDRRPVEVIKEDCLVKAQAFQSRFVEKQRGSLRHAFILQSARRLEQVRPWTKISVMKTYRLDASLNLIGAFWPPSDTNDVMTGTLSTLGGHHYLLAAPRFKRLDADEARAAFLEFGTAPTLRRIDTLLGQTGAGLCTLFHLVEATGDGLTDLSKQMQIVGERWRIGSAVMGLHIASAESESIDCAAFYLTRIHRWLPSATQINFTEEGRSYLLPSKALEFFRFESPSLDAEVACEIFSGNTLRKSVPRIKLTPRKPRSLEWFVSIRPRLENFFTLFLGSSVSVKSVQLFRGEEEIGWFIKKTRNRRQKTNVQTWVRSNPAQIAAALERWFSVPDDQRPVEKTVLGMVRHSSLYTETEFLALAQALEAFGRLRFERGLIAKDEFKQGLTKLRDVITGIWGESEIAKRCAEALSTANEASYGYRVGQTYDLLSPEFATSLLGERAQFVQKVVQTRNYFTHLGIRKGTAVIDDGGELFLLNQRLHAFLRCVMLIDLGTPESALKEPILYQSTRWKLL